MPPVAAAALRKLGGDLATARKRRRQSLRDWALRLQVSVPTLIRLEKGDPTVSMGVYATALWLVGRHEALGSAADPKEDAAALEAEIRAAAERHSPRGGRRG
ncbi:XRE family transcriptional regulator [Ramlibacter sp. GTP1]|uniref:XRE family transcriptional regulator n=1 Tax=Ramlibacter albus TaxID=2079448 RepID=A0A923M5G5_9BURK|nr:XRE family transcriptional regulator [Ramlibacter albus]